MRHFDGSDLASCLKRCALHIQGRLPKTPKFADRRSLITDQVSRLKSLVDALGDLPQTLGVFFQRLYGQRYHAQQTVFNTARRTPERRRLSPPPFHGRNSVELLSKILYITKLRNSSSVYTPLPGSMALAGFAICQVILVDSWSAY
jgi:hypothetical protein